MNDLSITRRGLLLGSGLTALRAQARAQAEQQERSVISPNDLAPFVDLLPIPSLAQPLGTRPLPGGGPQSAPYFRMPAVEFSCKLHRDLKPARLWGFGGSSPGPTFETRCGEAIAVERFNNLPHEHFLPVDHTIHGAEADKPRVRMISHLHGGRVAPQFDGYPEDWFEPGKSVLHHYPNQQDAALLWYHDHTMGINRLNVYAGMFGLYIIRDAFEEQLHLPKGKYEIPLVIYDRMIASDGQIYYPQSGNPKSPWIPELFGNSVLVNGKLLPYLEVEPRPYRFRLLNASNARQFHLSFLNGEAFHQIGSDQDLLSAPVPRKTLFIAPGERADLIVDFSRHQGEQIVVKTDFVPVMQFRISRAAATESSKLPDTLRPERRMQESEAVKTRILTLGEERDMVANPMRMLLNGMHWDMPITEKPVLNSTEIWTLVNLTEDSHPIHLHLVRFQILDRRPYDVFQYNNEKTIRYLGPPVPPEANELGWKDTARADPKMVTRIIVRFEGFLGRYVWHCHVLEHEDNEMMRPYELCPPDQRPQESKAVVDTIRIREAFRFEDCERVVSRTNAKHSFMRSDSKAAGANEGRFLKASGGGRFACGRC